MKKQYCIWMIVIVGISLVYSGISPKLYSAPRRETNPANLDMKVSRMITRLKEQTSLTDEEQAILRQFRSMSENDVYPEDAVTEKLQTLRDISINILKNKNGQSETERIDALKVLSEYIGDDPPEIVELVKHVCADTSESDEVRIEAIKCFGYSAWKKLEQKIAFLQEIQMGASKEVAAAIARVEEKWTGIVNHRSDKWRLQEERRQNERAAQRLEEKIKALEEKEELTAEEIGMLNLFRAMRKTLTTRSQETEQEPEPLWKQVFTKEKLEHLEQVIAELEAKEDKTEQEMRELRTARDSYAAIKQYLDTEKQNTPKTVMNAKYILVGIVVLIVGCLVGYLFYHRMKKSSRE